MLAVVSDLTAVPTISAGLIRFPPGLISIVVVPFMLGGGTPLGRHRKKAAQRSGWSAPPVLIPAIPGVLCWTEIKSATPYRGYSPWTTPGPIL